MNSFTRKHFASYNPIDYLIILLFISTHYSIKNNLHINHLFQIFTKLSSELHIPTLSKKTIHRHRIELSNLIKSLYFPDRDITFRTPVALSRIIIDMTVFSFYNELEDDLKPLFLLNSKNVKAQCLYKIY